LPHSAAGPHPRLPVWLEACRIEADVDLPGGNVWWASRGRAACAARRACLEVLPGRNRAREDVWFVRCYGIRDTFKNGLFCGCALLDGYASWAWTPRKSGPA